MQRRVPTQTQSGAHQDTWSTYRLAWVSLKPMRGTEAVHAGVNVEELLYESMARYTTEELTVADDRLVVGSRVFQVLSVVNEGERNEMLNMLLRELR